MDPHPTLCAEWQRLCEEYNALDSETPAAEAIYARMLAVEHLVRSTVATSPAGVLAQFDFMVDDCMEGGTYSAVGESVAQPFFEVFRASLTAALSKHGPTSTPMAVLFDKWARYWTWLSTTPDRHAWGDDELEARHDVLSGIEDRMEATTVATLADIALKFAATTSFGAVTFSDDRFQREVVGFLGDASPTTLRPATGRAPPLPAAHGDSERIPSRRIEAKLDAVLRCLKGQGEVDRIDARYVTGERAG